jgi:hypothetical protein
MSGGISPAHTPRISVLILASRVSFDASGCSANSATDTSTTGASPVPEDDEGKVDHSGIESEILSFSRELLCRLSLRQCGPGAKGLNLDKLSVQTRARHPGAGIWKALRDLLLVAFAVDTDRCVSVLGSLLAHEAR